MNLRSSLLLIIACFWTSHLLSQSIRRIDRVVGFYYGIGVDRPLQFDSLYQFPVRGNALIGIERKLGSQIRMGIEVNHHHLQVKRDDFRLRNRMLGIALKSKMLMIPVNNSYTRRPLLNPYLTASISYQTHNPQLLREGEWVNLKDIAGLENLATNTDFNWSAGFGVLAKANQYIDIFSEISIQVSTSNALYFDRSQLEPATGGPSIFGTNSFLSFSLGLYFHIPHNFFSRLTRLRLKTNSPDIESFDYKPTERFQDYLLQLSSKSQIPRVNQEFTRTRYVVINDQLDLPVAISLRNYASYHQIKKAEVIFKQDTVETRESFDRNI